MVRNSNFIHSVVRSSQGPVAGNLCSMPENGVEEEVLRFARKLDRIISGNKSEQDALDILKSLRCVQMTLEILQRTRVGMTVNELRKKTTNKAIQSEARNLIRIWKKLLGTLLLFVRFDCTL
ncbi:unnamed protein product [Soboliphyme baturini]|uniref:TFIIS N-terminal domain-containing protein n=1 Tax=Soboliphyme baturini TaxID=241478 RepID=A0A183ILS9_9BILA|nr:unnamed protein product [Soboliphyme baturini]